MPIASTNNSISYNPDGFTSTFNFPYPVIDANDLLVQTIDLFSNTVTTFLFGTNWIVPTLPDPFGSWPVGLDIHFITTAPALGFLLVIYRKTNETQLVQLLDNAPFVAGSINNALDKLTLMIQDIAPQYLGIMLNHPTTGTHSNGDWAINAFPHAGGFFGWVCTVSGTPGTWKTFGAISA